MHEFFRVREFHLAMGQPAPAAPVMQTRRMIERRAKWFREEIRELTQASDLASQADAYIDIMYFAVGGLVEQGLLPRPLFDIVHRANMSKVDDLGEVKRNQDGKIIKPPGWKPPEPDIVQAIQLQRKTLPLNNVSVLTYK